jgi:hypothetical protein
MVYLMMPTVTETTQRRIIGLLVNNELERMCKETAVVSFK